MKILESIKNKEEDLLSIFDILNKYPELLDDNFDNINIEDIKLFIYDTINDTIFDIKSTIKSIYSDLIEYKIHPDLDMSRTQYSIHMDIINNHHKILDYLNDEWYVRIRELIDINNCIDETRSYYIEYCEYLKDINILDFSSIIEYIHKYNRGEGI